MIFEAAHWLGAVPLGYLAWLRARGIRRDASWWWMALGFFVSWLADTATHYVPHPVISQVYPVTQAALFAFVLLPRRAVEWFVALLLAVAASSVAVRQGVGLDIALHVGAWGSVSALAWLNLQPGRLRDALCYGFAGLTLAWLAYTAAPGWVSWGALQGVRAVGIALWCRAVARA